MSRPLVLISVKLNKPFIGIYVTKMVRIISTFSIKTLFYRYNGVTGGREYRKISNFAERNFQYFQFNFSKIHF